MDLSRIHHPVTVLGHGARVGIWFQGCSIGCHGCVSQDTWTATANHRVEVDDVVAVVSAALRSGGLDGVTVSGGEPFDQAEALQALLLGIRAAAREKPALDVLCYTGHRLEHLQERHPDVLALLDAVVSDPFVARRAGDAVLRGSDNQRLTPLSPVGHERYGPAALGRMPRTRFQVAAEGGSLWYIGIPRRDDMARLEAHMRARGVDLQGMSWRS